MRSIMIKWLSQRWIVIYAVTGIVFFFLFREEPIAPRVSGLSYERRSEYAITEKLSCDQKPSSYELTWGIEYYKDLIDLLGPLASVYANMGYCYYYLGQFPQALEMYDKAIALNAGLYWYHWDKGMIYADLKEYDKAASFLQKALETMPATIRFYVDLSGREEFRQLVGEARVAQDLSFLLDRAVEDRIAALQKLEEVLRIAERKDLVAAPEVPALEKEDKKDIRLHFDATCFNSFFTTLKVLEKMNPGRVPKKN